MSARAGAADASVRDARNAPTDGNALNRGTMLRLRIVSDQRRSLGDRSSATFSVDGGTIGRSADNDWVLPDPPRYVSAHHARVEFREGSSSCRTSAPTASSSTMTWSRSAKRGRAATR